MTPIDCVLPAKNILVYDVAASESGALSVLNDFYAAVKAHKDKNINWTFVISTPVLEETENVKVIRAPWIKKNWACRMYYDYFVAPKIIERCNVDKVLSLQNVLIPRTNVPQVLYLHQPLPFVDKKFSLTEDYHFWMYQNIISKFIFSAIKNAEKVIVQTQWMKDACIEKTGVGDDKIVVIPPVIDIKPKKFFSFENMSIPTFIYPATPLIYKNHKVIVEACRKLVDDGINNFQVLFTLTGKENKLSQNLYEEVRKYNLPIKFIGKISREELFEWYSKAVLLFPSYIETFGLPLLEAKMHGAPVIAADTAFAREIVGGYNQGYFLQYNKDKNLVFIMKNSLNNDSAF